MKRKFIVSFDELEKSLRPQMAALRDQGIDSRGLLAYSVHAARFTDYRTLVGHMSKDLLEVNPGLLDDPHNYRRVLHSCMDYVMEAASHIAPYIERTCGVPCDHRVELEDFVGSRSTDYDHLPVDVVLSVTY